MDRETRRRFEEYRREQAGPIENTLIDELADGELDRGEFLQRATMFGLSVSAIGAALELSGHNPLAHAAPYDGALGFDDARGARAIPGRHARALRLRAAASD